MRVPHRQKSMSHELTEELDSVRNETKSEQDSIEVRHQFALRPYVEKTDEKLEQKVDEIKNSISQKSRSKSTHQNSSNITRVSVQLLARKRPSESSLSSHSRE